jgi:hypothetical protein
MNQQTKELLSRKQRQKNVNDILKRLDPNVHNYNTILLAFADIIQSSFYKYSEAQCKTEGQRRALHQRCNETINEIIQVLNKSGLSNAEDMIVLSTVMIEAINRAMIRGKESGLQVDTELYKSYQK